MKYSIEETGNGMGLPSLLLHFNLHLENKDRKQENPLISNRVSKIKNMIKTLEFLLTSANIISSCGLPISVAEI